MVKRFMLTNPPAVKTDPSWGEQAGDAEPMATVRLHSVSLVPEDVSEILGVRPTASARAGEAIGRTGDGQAVRAPTGTWYLDTMDRLASNDPAVHLGWIVDVVAPHVEKLEASNLELGIDFSLMMTGDHKAASLSLQENSSSLMEQVARGCTLGTVSLEIPSSGWRREYARKQLQPETHWELPLHRL